MQSLSYVFHTSFYDEQFFEKNYYAICFSKITFIALMRSETKFVQQFVVSVRSINFYSDWFNTFGDEIF
jgi:hypothetical protein